ncbi:MAG: glycoside hydrolase family 15 protein [Thermoleophilia bacterium]|nr:glycoside hydrolase family 15 protein [Thermoleophilia bacterium]
MLPLEATCGDGGHLYRGSYTLLLSHEDKAFPGALIASVAIPWGEVMGDEDTGGYHLVWTRDLVNSATGLLAAGNKDTPSTPTALGIAFADIVTTPDQKGSIRFTFFWPEAGGWEGTNYQVTVDSAG